MSGFTAASASSTAVGGASDTAEIEPLDDAADDEVIRDLSPGETDPETRAVEQALIQNMDVVQTSTAQAGAACQPDAEFDVLAINVEITLNRFNDHDPEGRMFVLREELDRVRAEEAANRASRQNGEPSAVSNGLKNDAIQPLVIRANLGDCVQITLENQLDGEDASLHFHRASVEPNQAGSNVGNNDDSTLAPGESGTYTFQIEDREELEGAFYFHSHGNTREQTSHGLFGELVAEPAGFEFIDPNTGGELKSGWEAIIAPGEGAPEGSRAFREYALFYHEIGNEQFKIRDKNGFQVEQFEQVTNTYRPASRALNYRSEPFLRRLQTVAGLDSTHKPLTYASYTFGDPATPTPRSYVGDPSKTRLTHGGSENFHSHHLHGGSIRWPWQPKTGSEETRIFDGLDKRPDISLSDSEFLDVQNIGPGETYNLEHNCGAGGCQQGAGEFLYHCHFINHYPAGMWGFWRVFDTQQSGLVALTDFDSEAQATPDAVDSTALIGVELADGTTIIDGPTDPTAGVIDVRDWVESQLPPQGQRATHEATSMDWAVDNSGGPPLYLSEELGPYFENYQPGDRINPNVEPGERQPILFNSENGRVAFPLLTPHRAQRPPFAPNRDGAPYLRSGVDPATGQVNPNDHPTNSSDTESRADPLVGESSICPAGAPITRFNMVAIDLPVDRRPGAVDAQGNPLYEGAGEIWVLAEDVDAVLAGEKPAHQAALRPNVGDCVEFTVVNGLQSTRQNTRVNFHGHFMQFDTQASDGVISGLSFEQSMFNYRNEGRWLTASVSAGDTVVPVTTTNGLSEGGFIGVGVGTDGIEVHKIASVTDDAITLAEPLVRDHAVDGGLNQDDNRVAVSVEFNRQTWYMDNESGTIYFHDHVDGTRTWPRGLFGAMIVQPEGAVTRDPQTGQPVKNAPIADIDCTNCVRTVADANGDPLEVDVDSYRDFAFFITENDTGTGGSSYNLRAEPLAIRDGDPALKFSSREHGDPATPLLRAYEGDPVRVRLLHGGPGHDGALSWRLTGHRFATERHEEARGSGGDASVFEALTIANAERFDPMIQGGAGEAGDYMYYNAQGKNLEIGSWGIFRVHDEQQGNLQVLAGRDAPTPQPSPIPGGDADVTVDVVAMPFPSGPAALLNDELPFDQNESGEPTALFVPAEDAAAVASGEKAPEPLVIRAAAGEVIDVNLTNQLEGQSVSLHPGRVLFDPNTSQGITVGDNDDQHVASGDSRTYRWYADQELRGAVLADFGNAPTGQAQGLYGSIVIGPEGATFTDPVTGEDTNTGWQAVVTRSNGEQYRDFALVFHESDDFFGNAQPLMPYRGDVRGFTGINYASEPLIGLDGRFANGTESQAYDSDTHGDPSTPILQAFAGDEVHIHVTTGFGHSAGVFAIDGHRWAYDPNVDQSELLAARTWTPHQTIDVILDGGAGGPMANPGDYLYQNHRLPYTDAGQWGILRVHSAEGAAGNGGVVGLNGVPQA